MCDTTALRWCLQFCDTHMPVFYSRREKVRTATAELDTIVAALAEVTRERAALEKIADSQRQRRKDAEVLLRERTAELHDARADLKTEQDGDNEVRCYLCRNEIAETAPINEDSMGRRVCPYCWRNYVRP